MADHGDQLAVQVIDRDIAAGAFLIACHHDMPGGIDPLQRQLVGVGIGHQGAVGGQAQFGLGNVDIAGQHDTLLLVLQLHVIGGKIDRRFAVVRHRRGQRKMPRPGNRRHRQGKAADQTAERQPGMARARKGRCDRRVSHGLVTCLESVEEWVATGAAPMTGAVLPAGSLPGMFSLPGTMRSRACPSSRMTRVSRSATK